MNITVQQGEIQKRKEEAVVVNLFEGVRPGGATKAVDDALGGAISEAIDCGDFTGKKGKTLLLYSNGRLAARRVLLTGLGKQDEFDLEMARQAAGAAARTLQGLKVSTAAPILHSTGAGGLEIEEAAQAVAEASTLACYRFDNYRSRVKQSDGLRKLTIVEFDSRRITAARRGARNGSAIAAGVCTARDLANHPGSVATPSFVARTARRVARAQGMSCRVLDEPTMKKLGMGAILAVSRGSSEPARFVVLEHNKKAGEKPLVFVGKGITFDSGGLSIKPGSGMEEMKFDMCGAAAVVGAMQAVAALKLNRHVVGLLALSENMLGASAYKPGDVLTALNGKTIEIRNTDAEGRLVLADALSYAARFKPAGAVDLATLTGACVVALGNQCSGMMGNDEALAEKVRAAGEATGERVWPLPLWPEYREQINSDIADMKNTGGRAAGSITAAALLAEFAEPYPWVHLDIAGTAWSGGPGKSYVPKGGVGVGVRLLTQLARDWKSR